MTVEETTNPDVTEATPVTEPVAVDAAPESAELAEEVVETNPNFKWYAVNTYSNYENRAKKGLEERIKQHKLQDFFGEVLVPVETVEEVRNGQRRTQKRKFFPGYMIVQMELTDQTWHLVKNTPKVTGFVGGTNKTNPPPLRDAEVARLTQQISTGPKRVAPKVEYAEGDTVRVIDGPFANFNGNVDEVKADKQKVRVMVSILGRLTPVELDFMQVEKVG